AKGLLGRRPSVWHVAYWSYGCVVMFIVIGSWFSHLKMNFHLDIAMAALIGLKYLLYFFV
ncbi:MAG: hypothetical protein WA941_23515, partial [Nitrososphaeraceae archaeon]